MSGRKWKDTLWEHPGAPQGAKETHFDGLLACFWFSPFECAKFDMGKVGAEPASFVVNRARLG